MLGYANWEEIAKKFDKTPMEIERHFKCCYEKFFGTEFENEIMKRIEEIKKINSSGM